jgi:hypothetical protein
MKAKFESKATETAVEPVIREIEPPKPATRPLSESVKFIKCVYSGPVKVNCPSGKRFSFAPGQIQPVHNPADYHYLLALKRNPGPGCCASAGTPAQDRFYFEAVEFKQEV